MSDEHSSSQLEGWTAPIYEPLTRRTMFGGVPFTLSVGLGFVAFQLFALRLYAFLFLPMLAFIALRAVYKRDEWALGAWIDHVLDVIGRATTLDV